MNTLANISTTCSRQRGSALFIALISLVTMTLAGIALVRSVDTINLISGNFSFRQAALHASDLGVEAASTLQTAPRVQTANTTPPCRPPTPAAYPPLPVRGLPCPRPQPTATRSSTLLIVYAKVQPQLPTLQPIATQIPLRIMAIKMREEYLLVAPKRFIIESQCT
jgi:hypothetical protein